MKSGNQEFEGGNLGLLVFVVTAIWLILFHTNILQ